RVAALAGHVGVGDQAAEVGVTLCVLREEDNARVEPGPSGVADRQGGAQDGAHAGLRAGVDESGGAVQAVAIGEGDGGHAELGGSAGELLGEERPVLQRKVRADVQVDERALIEHVFDSRTPLRHDANRSSGGLSKGWRTRYAPGTTPGREWWRPT